MVNYSDDEELFAIMQDRLYSAVISDILDSLDIHEQVMRADISPVYNGARVIGRVYPILSADVFKRDDNPYKGEIEAVDSLKPGDVVVWSTNQSTRTCVWGELLSTAARARGARGAIIDGYTRDVPQITSMEFPTFATGRKPVDSAGRSVVIHHGCLIRCGDVLVNTGDIVFGDIDGIVVIPKKVERKVLTLSLEKVEKENLVRDELLSGKMLRDAFNKHKIL